MNIFEKMAAITAELQTVAKNLNVETGKGKGYKAVSERDIIDAVKPLEAKYGVYSYPADREVLESAMLDTDTQYGKKTTFFTRIKTTYCFVNIEKPDDFIETITFAEGIDAQDKGSGKAMTYADKYALMKAYKISTGDDPDAEPSNDEHYTRDKLSKFPEAPKCECCGKSISTLTRRDGSLWPIADIVGYSQKRYGMKLCGVCMKARDKAEKEAAKVFPDE